MKKRKRLSAAQKSKIALEAAKGAKTLSELSSEFEVHPTQISQWKRQLLDGVEDIFQSRRPKQQREHEQLQEQLYQTIGKLQFELEWLKKKAAA